jgi:hypothetical protein
MPNLIYVQRETEVVWKSSGGDALWTPTSLANGAGRQGARYDLYGAVGAKAGRYEWRLAFKLTGTPTVGDPVRVYLATWDEGGGRGDNDDGTGDIAVSAEDKLKNLHQIGTVLVDEAAVVETVGSGIVEIVSRYVAPVIWNEAIAWSATAADHEFSLTPVPYEVQ